MTSIRRTYIGRNGLPHQFGKQDTPRATLPATPRRVVLTPAAKRAIRTAVQLGDGCFLDLLAYCDKDLIAELLRLGLVDDLGNQVAHIGRHPLTEAGLRMRSYEQHQFYLGKLANQVRAEGIDGEDLADVAAAIDAGEETGSIPGTSVDFQLAFALAASLTDQSAEDLRGELEHYMGWKPGC